MKMSTILASLMVPAVTTSASLHRPRLMHKINSCSINGGGGQSSLSIQRQSSGGSNNYSCRRGITVAAFTPSSSLLRQFSTSSNKPSDKLTKSRSTTTTRPRLPWTPICETNLELFTKPHSQSWTQLQMMNNPNLPSEGFRDAHRGGMEYIKEGSEQKKKNKKGVGGGDNEQGGVNGATVESGGKEEMTIGVNEQHVFQQRHPPPPPTTTSSSQQPTTTKGFGFPKLSPGRQRNYKSPMTEAQSALQQSFRRKNVVSSLERVVYPAKGAEQDQVVQSQQQQQQQQVNIQPQQQQQQQEAISPTIQVQPSRSENFRDDVQRFKGSGSDGSTSQQLQQLPKNDKRKEGPNSVLPAVDSSGRVVVQTLDEGGELDSADTIPTSNDNHKRSNKDNDPFRGKSNQYYEKVGPQSMNFRDGSRMNTYKDKAFAVAASDLRDVVEEEEDVVVVNGGGGLLVGDVEEDEMMLLDDDEVEEEEEEELIMDDDDDDEEEEEEDEDDEHTMNESVPVDVDKTKVEEAEVPPTPSTATTSKKQEAAISNTGMDTSELSLDPKFIDFLPSDQVKEEEDLLLDEDSDVNEGEGAEPYMSTQLLKARLHDLLEDAESGSFVKMFRGSASYIANHRGTVAVYHIPGELLTWEGFPGLMDDIALTWLLGMKIVLVAGCRHQIDLRLEEDEGDEGDRGYSGKVMMSSIRVTDEDTLRVVKEEAGFVRFEIERRLAKSLRLHGGLVKGSESLVGNVVSGNFYSAQPFGVIDGIDYCWTGFPRKVEVERIRQVHESNDIVLLTSLGVSPSGEIFNVNSEFLAASVAGAVSASKIVYFNVHGTLFQNKNTNKPVQNLRVSDAKNLLAHYKMKIHPKGFALVDLDGNTPQQQVLRTPGSMETLIKVGYSMVALEKGVKRAHILAPENGALVQELYTRDGCGTLISRDIYEGIRRADVNDVSGIYDLIDPLVRAGTLVPRPKSTLEKEITGYYVYTRDGLIVATGQLKRFEGGFAEIGCLVVNKDYRKGGRGDAMLGYLERLSLQCGAQKVFVLSTQTMDWFVERGFREVSVESLPPSRQAMYNKKRKSKIYMKEIDGERDLDAAELWWSNQVSS